MTRVASRLVFLVAYLLPHVAHVARAEHVIPSVPLGASDLDIVVTLRLLEHGSTVETDESPDAITITDHEDGSYGFAGLPDASGRDRYVLLIATSAEPTRHLYRYEYGAESGASIVFRQEVSDVLEGDTIVQGDTYGTISITVASGLPGTVGSATATFTAINARNKSVIVSDRPAIISNVVLDAVTNSYGATLTYDLESTLTANPAAINAEFTVSFPNAEDITLPRVPMRLEIRKKLD